MYLIWRYYQYISGVKLLVLKIYLRRCSPRCQQNNDKIIITMCVRPRHSIYMCA